MIEHDEAGREKFESQGSGLQERVLRKIYEPQIGIQLSIEENKTIITEEQHQNHESSRKKREDEPEREVQE